MKNDFVLHTSDSGKFLDRVGHVIASMSRVGFEMPLVQIKGVGATVSKPKAGLIRRVTDAVVSVEGEGLRSQVIAKTFHKGRGVGGSPVNAGDLRKMASG